MSSPSWLMQLKWLGGIHVAALTENRKQIPDFTECDVFTVGKALIAPGRVLYVGEAAVQTQRQRLASYLVDFSQQPKKREGHKGRGFILEARHRSGDHGVYVSWVEYGASPSPSPSICVSWFMVVSPPPHFCIGLDAAKPVHSHLDEFLICGAVR